MEPEETQQFLDELLAIAMRPEFVYVHEYKLGDMLIDAPFGSRLRPKKQNPFAESRELQAKARASPKGCTRVSSC